MLECVINLSEGRDREAVALIAGSAGSELLDVHTDPDHHRSVITIVGEPAAYAVGITTVLRLDLSRHSGAHPRFGALDVVPFVPIGSTSMADAIAARDRFASWIGGELGVPAFLYGPERTLPEVRRRAFVDLAPDTGPAEPHPTAGACAVGARGLLVAYNLWLRDPSIELARRIAKEVRGPAVRALGLQVGDRVQVSMNLIDPLSVGPARVYESIAEKTDVERCELVGLIPEAVLDAIPPAKWELLDVGPYRTIESRVEARGLRTG